MMARQLVKKRRLKKGTNVDCWQFDVEMEVVEGPPIPCSGLQHIYPCRGGQPVAPGTPCRCGKKTWGPLRDAIHHPDGLE
jgi:hypothetical protein